MSRVGFVLYRPRKGKEDELVEMIKSHFPFLRQQGLITERRTLAMRAKDGSIIVAFEWTSRASIEAAAANAGVQERWMQVSKISDFEKPVGIKEFHETFPDFETVELE